MQKTPRRAFFNLFFSVILYNRLQLVFRDVKEKLFRLLAIYKLAVQSIVSLKVCSFIVQIFIKIIFWRDYYVEVIFIGKLRFLRLKPKF